MNATEPATNAQPEQRQSPLRAMVPMLVLDIGLPMAAYYALHAAGMSDFWALTAGGLVSGVRVLWSVLQERRLDGFAAFVLTLFAFGLVMAFLSGDARFVMAKDSAGSGLAGLIMLGTCVVGKPFVYYTARRFVATGDPEKQAGFDHLFRTSAPFRSRLRLMSVVWGVGLLTEAVLRIVLIYLLPISTMVALSTMIQVVSFGGLMAWSAWFGKRGQQQRAQAVTQAA